MRKGKLWAVLNGKENSINNCYTIDTEGLHIIDLDQYGILYWIAEIISHRGVYSDLGEIYLQDIIERYKLNISQADILIGYRADGHYMEIIQYFMENKLSIFEVEKLFKRGNLGTQVCILSEKAYNRINFEHAYKVPNTYDCSEYIKAEKDIANFLIQREYEYNQLHFKLQGLTLMDVIDQNLQLDPQTGYYIPGFIKE